MTSAKKTGKSAKRKAPVKKASRAGVKKRAPVRKQVKRKARIGIKRKAVRAVTSKKRASRPAKRGVPKGKSAMKKRAPPAKRPPTRRAARQEIIEMALMHEPAPKKKVVHPLLPWGDSPRVKAAVQALKELARAKEVSDWKVNLIHARKANLYAGKGLGVEHVLSATREDVSVTAYLRYPDGRMGATTLTLLNETPAELKSRIQDALTLCEHAKRPGFDLPSPTEDIVFPEGHDPKMLTAFMAGEGEQVPRAMHAAAVQLLPRVQDARINSMEILCSAATVRVLNSNGVDVSYHKTSVLLDVVMTSVNGKEEREHHASRLVVSPEQIDMRSFLESQARMARDSARATWCEEFTGDALISGDAVVEVLAPELHPSPPVLHAMARMHLLKLSRFTLGAPIGEFKGEPFTLSSNPLVPLGYASVPVDDDGTPLRPVEMIRNGIFLNVLAPAKDAKALGVPVTGGLANVQIAQGATREEHLRGHDYVEIVSFSWFNPDPYSGDFAAEIRLGYRWKMGKPAPFRGGVITGNLFKMLCNARFSKEISQTGSYYGPRAVLFKNAVVKGRSTS